MMLWVVSILVFSACGALAQAEPKLPVGNANKSVMETEDADIPGAILLTQDPIPNEPIEDAVEPLKVDPPEPGEIAEDHAQAPEIPEEFLAAYFAERPKSFLIDPQGLLRPADFRERLDFLNYHAGDSMIDLFVYVMGADQVIPSEIRVEELTERFFSQSRPAAVVFYYFGAPQRSKLILSPSIMDVIPATEQRRALESSIMQAFERTAANEQFEKFLVQMSIRIYWMERMLAGEDKVDEKTPLKAALAATAGKTSAKWLMVQDLGRKYAFPVGVAVAALVTILGINFVLRFRRRYRFPEFDVEPRLGGGHAAGIGAVISFASATVPPASQRDQVPDYLRRA
jgi:hypothetical protein